MYFLIDEENGGDHEQIDNPNIVIYIFEIVLSTMALKTTTTHEFFNQKYACDKK